MPTKFPGITIVRDASTVDTNIVDDGNRRNGSPSPDKVSLDRSIEAGGEYSRVYGAKSSPQDGRPSLTRCKSLHPDRLRMGEELYFF
jgi:hypothetical protein